MLLTIAGTNDFQRLRIPRLHIVPQPQQPRVLPIAAMKKPCPPALPSQLRRPSKPGLTWTMPMLSPCRQVTRTDSESFDFSRLWLTQKKTMTDCMSHVSSSSLHFVLSNMSCRSNCSCDRHVRLGSRHRVSAEGWVYRHKHHAREVSSGHDE